LSQNINFEYYPQLTIKELSDARDLFLKNKANWDEPFFTNTSDYVNLNEIKEVCEIYRKHEDIKNVIVLGTGGSIQTLKCLKHLSKKKIFPITSSRPKELKDCLKKSSERNSLVIPISRGGKTLDVNSTIGLFQQENFPFLGLASRGPMYDLLKEMGAPILDVPDLSGRFAGSITNVGIVPAYIGGIDVESFLNYLRDAYSIFTNLGNIGTQSQNHNYALELSAYLYGLYTKGFRNIFSMPYSSYLEGVTGLFVQEISESSGKDGKGLIGTFQSAPLCQHSILEFLLGGSKGFVSPILWTTDETKYDYILNSNFEYINGKSANDIINFQADATFQALVEKKVPSAKISVRDIDLKSIAELIALIQTSVYIFCVMLDVNWADNPSVNIGKEICNTALKANKSKEERIQDRKNVARENL